MKQLGGLMYSLADLEAAKAEWKSWEDRWDSYSGNNPDKYHSQREMAQAKVRAIEQYLKSAGALPLSEQEVLERDLERLFPNAKSKDVIEHRGIRYQRRFSPAARSRKGSVTRWDKSWVAIP